MHTLFPLEIVKEMLVHLQWQEFYSFIVEIWVLDQCSEHFIPPKDVEMFQSKLIDDLKIYIKSSISLNLVAPWSN